MRSLLSVVVLAVLLAPALVPSHANAAPSSPATSFRVAVIDTGIDATHPEFRPDQVVAWRDFTSEQSPTPVDGHGHGTATASLVAGLNQGSCGGGLSGQKLSFAPGADLVVARVGTDDGTIEGSLAGAITWAVQQNASVISISIGAIVPFPVAGSKAIADARAKGVLVVVSAGNGLANFGLAPYPAWSTTYSNDRHVLSVGAGSRTGASLTSLTGNMDPDLVSWGDRVCVAIANEGTYDRMSGTSFSAPLVAGMAATAMDIARANGRTATPDQIERLLLYSATNSPFIPYAREGMGFLLDAQWPLVQEHAAAGTLPRYEAQGEHARYDRIYHDNVVETLRGSQGLLFRSS